MFKIHLYINYLQEKTYSSWVNPLQHSVLDYSEFNYLFSVIIFKQPEE